MASATKASFQATKESSVLVPVAPSASSDHTVTVIDRTFVFYYLNFILFITNQFMPIILSKSRIFQK